MSETKKVLVTLPVTEEDKAYFKRQAEGGSFRCLFTYLPGEEVSEEAAASFDAIIGNIAPSLLHGGAKPEWMQLNSAGAESYAGTDGLGENAVLTNAAGAYGPSVSEHMVALTFGMIRKMRGYGLLQDAHDWRALGSVTAVEESTVLVMGTGDIGGSYARRMKALGAYTIGVRRHNKPKPDYLDEQYTMDELDRLIGRADIIAMVMPGGDATYHVMDGRRLRLMKEGAFLLNVGRGSSVDCAALAEVLKEGHLGGAALDVTEPAPLPADHPLWDTDNVTITPHVAGNFFLHSTLERIIRIAGSNLRHWTRGEAFEHRVDRTLGY